MIKSADIVDKLIMYFIEHGMQVLTGLGILAAGVFCSRWAGNTPRAGARSSARGSAYGRSARAPSQAASMALAGT